MKNKITTILNIALPVLCGILYVLFQSIWVYCINSLFIISYNIFFISKKKNIQNTFEMSVIYYAVAFLAIIIKTLIVAKINMLFVFALVEISFFLVSIFSCIHCTIVFLTHRDTE